MAISRMSQADLNRKKPGMYCDGGGLWLQISIAKDGKHRNRSWIFRWAIPDDKRKSGYRTREMGLGSVDTVGLALARERALRCRQQRLDGLDPIVERETERAAKAAAAAKVTTFDQAAALYLAKHSMKWRSKKHGEQWAISLRQHASPMLGHLPVQQIDTALVVKTLERIWHKSPESGSRLRNRIEMVLDFATASNFRVGDNPAKWVGLLENLLPSRRELLPVKHFTAMAYTDVPAMMAALRKREGTVARALEMLTLCASRTGEILGARWDEIEVAARTWTIPGGRMKSGETHIVPLTARCLEILADMQEIRQSEFVFPGSRGALISSPMMARLLKLLGYAVTVHGQRAAFRTWAAESTTFAHEVAELALAHAIGDEVTQSYKRTTLFEKRRKLMDQWSLYCSKPAPVSATVTPIRQVRAGA